MSSSLNSCATAATHDLYRPWAGARATPERELRMTRWLTALFGAVQIGVGIGGQWVQASVVATVLGIAAFTTGLVLGVFLLYPIWLTVHGGFQSRDGGFTLYHVQQVFVDPAHGHPLSSPAAASSSESFFRA